jgi:hypothetical protein
MSTSQFSSYQQVLRLLQNPIVNYTNPVDKHILDIYLNIIFLFTEIF